MENERALQPDALNTILQRLGRPFFSVKGVSLYVGDCRELMGRLPSSSVSLTVTSPPYNIGKEYERRMDLQDYLSWVDAWCRDIHRVTTVDGALWLNLGYVSVPGRGRAVPLPYLIWPRLPFYFVQEVVWHYGAGVAARRMFSPRNEKWLWLVKDDADYVFDLDSVRDPNVKYPNQKKNGKLRVNQSGKNPSDVWVIPKVTAGSNMDGQRASPERTKHPAQFPEAVIERIVRSCSRPDSLILDPFAGSGTTGVIALRTHRNCVLFEINERYAEIAARRLDAASRILTLL